MRRIEKMPRSSGVYQITSQADGKVYIGGTANVYRRCHIHRHHLRAGTHQNRYLQQAWNKHGAHNFTVRILELVAVSRLERREAFWADHYHSHTPKHGYNIAGMPGVKRAVPKTVAQKLAVAKTAERRWIVTSPDGAERAVVNLTQFCTKLSLNLSMLYRVAYGRARHWRGWKCRPDGMNKKTAERRLPPPRDTKFKPGRWLVTSPRGELFVVEGLRRFCEARGLHAGVLADVANGKRGYRHYKGWTCRKEVTDADRAMECRVAKSEQPAALSAGR